MFWTSILKRLLTVSVFTILPVSSVESYTCANSACMNGVCIPAPEGCEASHGCFSRALKLNVLGLPANITVQHKGCPADVCTDLAFSATLGHWTLSYEQQCCWAEQCNEPVLLLSLSSSQVNGVQCPACYNDKDMSCDPVPLSCTGAETECVDVIGEALANDPKSVLFGKGCATETACNLNISIFDARKIQILCTGRSSPPTSNSGVPTSGSPPLKCLSSVLTSLLLLQVRM